MQDTAGEVMYSYGPQYMAGQKQDDQLEHTFSSYVRIRDVTLKTFQRRWTIGRSDERASGISVLAAWHDDDDDYFLTLIVVFATGKWFLVLLADTNNSIWFWSFVRTQINCFKYSKWLNSPIWLVDETLTGTTTTDRRGTGSNDNKGMLQFFKAPDVEPHYHMQFSVISRTLIVGLGSYASAELKSALSREQANRV